MTTEKKAEGWIDDLVGALCDPVIVYPSPWKDDLPDWVKPQITLERLVMNMKVVHEGGVPVGDTEALAYIFPPHNGRANVRAVDEDLHLCVYPGHEIQESGSTGRSQMREP